MPRDLGNAHQSDLTGNFVGEQSEQVSSLARFLVSAGQIAPPAQGSVFGNGRHDHDTEVAGRKTEVPATRSGTEVSDRLRPGGNGAASDTVFDQPLPSLEMEPEAMVPQPLSLDADNGELQPQLLDLSPGLDGPQPAALAVATVEPEPEALDSIPDLTSPENDAPAEDEGEPVTDKLPPRPSQRPPVVQRDLPPPLSSSDTGLLSMDALPAQDIDQLTPEELRADEETNLQVGADPSEKITSKVEPRSDLDPRSRDPEAVVRDTVNFYNQTQSLHGKPAAAASQPSAQDTKPRIAGTVPLMGRPREFEDQPSRRFTPPPLPKPLPEPELQQSAFDSDDLLAPEPLAGELAPETASALDAEDDLDAAQRKDTDKFLEDDRRPAPLPKPVGTERSGRTDPPAKQPPAGQPRELQALAPEKVAAGKDTQKFFVADILARKDEPKPSSDSTGELQPAEAGRPLAPSAESTTDTSFDVATERQSTVREARAVPAPASPPKTRRLEPAPRVELPQPVDVDNDFEPRYAGATGERIIPEYEGIPDEARGQPEPGDFDDEAELEAAPAGMHRAPVAQGQRDGVAEDVSDAGVAEGTADGVAEEESDFTDQEPPLQDGDVERITERVQKQADTPPEKSTAPSRRALPGRAPAPAPAGRAAASQPVRPVAPTTRKAPAAASARPTTPRQSDEISRRLETERLETLRLLETAEELAQKLRAASEQSRTDLLAISGRRRAAPQPEPDTADTSFDQPVPGVAPDMDSMPTRILRPAEFAQAPQAAPVPVAASFVSHQDAEDIRDPVEAGIPSDFDAFSDSNRLPKVSAAYAAAATGTPMPAPGTETASVRTRRQRVPTQAIGDIVSAIESKLGGGEPLSDLLKEASRRITRRIDAADPDGGNGNGNGNGHHGNGHRGNGSGGGHDDGFADDDMDHLVAASASLRAVIESDHEAEHETHQIDERQPIPDLVSEAVTRRVVAESPLAQDLDRMWKELSARKTTVVSRAEPVRITRELETGLGWTQEALWRTLVGIALVTFFLGGMFVWIVYLIFS